MANVINLPTYEQSEQIKEKLNNGVGVSWDKYTSFLFSRSVPSTTVFSTVYETQGEGFLKKACIAVGGTSTGRMKVIIDGEEISSSSVSGSANAAGIVHSDDLDSGLKVSVSSQTRSVTKWESISNLTAAVHVITTPIFFKNSLVIQLLNTSDGGSVICEVTGGVIL